MTPSIIKQLIEQDFGDMRVVSVTHLVTLFQLNQEESRRIELERCMNILNEMKQDCLTEECWIIDEIKKRMENNA